MSSLADSCDKKRKNIDLTKEDYEDIFAPTQHEKDRDKSIAEFFNIGKLEATMRIMEKTSNNNRFFDNLSDDIKAQAQEKYESIFLDLIGKKNGNENEMHTPA